MQHRGEIIEQAVRGSGYSLTKLAQKLGKSRRWIYLMFQNSNVPIETIIEIGKIIHYDFSKEISALKKYKIPPRTELSSEASHQFSGDFEEAEFWKKKYLELLEKYNDLLQQLISIKVKVASSKSQKK